MCAGRFSSQAMPVGILYLSCVLVMLLPCVASTFFSINDGTTRPCIYLDVEFSAKITAKYKGRVVAEKSVTDTDVQGSSGSCQSSNGKITLSLVNGGIDFTFTFTSEYYTGGNVKLVPDIIIQPKTAFDHLEPFYGDVCFKGSSKSIGNRRSSYMCSRKDKTYYRSVKCGTAGPPNSAYKYSVEVDLKKIQAQAFEIQNQVFSPPVYCAGPRNYAGIIAGSVVGALVLLVIVAVVAFFVLRRMKSQQQPDSSESSVQSSEPDEKSPLVEPDQGTPQNNGGPA